MLRIDCRDATARASSPTPGQRPQRGVGCRPAARLALLLLAFTAVPVVASAAHGQHMPEPAPHAGQSPGPHLGQTLGFEQHIGEPVPPQVPFKTAEGRSVTLGEYLKGDLPILLAPVYYECPTLCGLTMEGIGEALETMRLRAGKDFRVVLFSIDPGEGPAEARARAGSLARAFPNAGVPEGWHLLTGAQPAIDALTRAIGFEYAYDDARDEYVHTAGSVLLTPDGIVDRYLLGVQYPPTDLRLGLLESARGRIGSMPDRLLLRLYEGDPQTGRYSLSVMRVLRLAVLAAGALVAGGIALLVLLVLRARRRRIGGKEALRGPIDPSSSQARSQP